MPRLRQTASPSFSAKFPQPLDRAALIAIAIIATLLAILLLVGDRVAPHVRDFSWQSKDIGADDTAFLLTFNRPMDIASVEQNLQITPPLPGRVSWAGRRMAYTLNFPAPYGKTFNLELTEATDQLGNEAGSKPMRPFLASFQTRDRAFAYIGVEADETERLMLYNLTQQARTALTPPNLRVIDFQPYPLGDRILFSAVDRTVETQGELEQKLYTVTTGIHVTPPDTFGEGTLISPVPADTPAGQVTQILDNTEYQNLKFDLSPDGQTIVVQRGHRERREDFGPWILRDGEAPKPLEGDPGGDFLITPDSQSLAISQGQGLAILPLQPNADPLEFLPKFGTVLTFSKDGSLAAMVKFNTDYTRSLFLVTNQGTQTELLRTKGSIKSATFDPARQHLYCLLTELKIEGDLYQEQPYLAVIDLKTKELTPLVRMPQQWDVQISLAPDGLALLFDQAVAADDTEAGLRRGSSGKAIASSRLWLMPIQPDDPTVEPQLEELPMAGLRPQWLP